VTQEKRDAIKAHALDIITGANGNNDLIADVFVSIIEAAVPPVCLWPANDLPDDIKETMKEFKVNLVNPTWVALVAGDHEDLLGFKFLRPQQIGNNFIFPVEELT
jgi:hypothetical protein